MKNIFTRMLMHAVVFAFALLLTTPIFAQTPTLHANGKIAFTSDRDGTLEIYVMNADGTNQVRLTNNSVVDDHATWSPDGTKLAFLSQRTSGEFAIFQMNGDGTGKTEITPVNYYPPNLLGWDYWSMSWSPDGRQMTFQDRSANGEPGIYIVNADGSSRRFLTRGLQPSWSPDGSKILFSNQPEGIFFYWWLFTIRPDGTNLQALPGAEPYVDTAPTWSASGDRIVFQGWDWANTEDLVVANADGTNRQTFASGCNAPGNPFGQCGGLNFPDWSPDGSKIVFYITAYGSGGSEIWVKNIDGDGLRQLTNTTGNNVNPSWQPLASPACAYANPIDCPDFFIRQQYRDFLGREADSSGFANWMATLGACPNGGYGEFDNPFCDRIHVSAGFVRSHEFQGRGYWVLRFGFVGLNRSIGAVRSSATYAEFTPALAQIGGSNSPAQEEAAKVTYTNAFVQRQDFLALFPSTMTAAQYVNALESNAKVSLPNKQALIDALNAGTMTRADVLRNVVESQVVFDKYLIPAFVTMEYFGYLRRDPDQIGYQNWVNTLTAEPSNYRHMIFGFIYSTEYRQRFGPP